jgi:hypothetical protein
MPAVYMHVYRGDGLRSDYKPSYDDFLHSKKLGPSYRLNDHYPRAEGSEVINGITSPVVRWNVTFTGHNARSLILDRPEFVFMEYLGVVSYCRVNHHQPGKNIVDISFKELLYDIKAKNPDKWVG